MPKKIEGATGKPSGQEMLKGLLNANKNRIKSAIEKGEADRKAGRTYSLEDVEKIAQERSTTPAVEAPATESSWRRQPRTPGQ